MSTSIGTVRMCGVCRYYSTHVGQQPVPFVPARPDGTLLASVLPRLEHKPESSEDSYCN